MKYMFVFSGLASSNDKTRNIEKGDEDSQALICDDSCDPRSQCELIDPVLTGKYKLNKNWQGA